MNMNSNFKCEVCSQTFTRKQHISRHMRTHTGEKPYSCLYCPEAFSRSDLLSRHQIKCHPEHPVVPKRTNGRPGSRINKNGNNKPLTKSQKNKNQYKSNKNNMINVNNENTINEAVNEINPTLVGNSIPTTETDSNFLVKNTANNWFMNDNNINVNQYSSIIQLMEEQQSQQQQLQQIHQMQLNNPQLQTQQFSLLTPSIMNFLEFPQNQNEFSNFDNNFKINDLMSNFLNSPSLNKVDKNSIISLGSPSTSLIKTPLYSSKNLIDEEAKGSDVTKDFINQIKMRSQNSLKKMTLQLPSNTHTRIIEGNQIFKLNTNKLNVKKKVKCIKYGEPIKTADNYNADDIPQLTDSPSPPSSSNSSSIPTPNDYSKNQAAQALEALQKLRIKENDQSFESFLNSELSMDADNIDSLLNSMSGFNSNVVSA